MYKGSIVQAWPIDHPAGSAVISLQVPQVMLESMICHYSAKHSIACSVRKTHAPTNRSTQLSVSLTNKTSNSWAWPSTIAKRLQQKKGERANVCIWLNRKYCSTGISAGPIKRKTEHMLPQMGLGTSSSTEQNNKTEEKACFLHHKLRRAKQLNSLYVEKSSHRLSITKGKNNHVWLGKQSISVSNVSAFRILSYRGKKQSMMHDKHKAGALSWRNRCKSSMATSKAEKNHMVGGV